eukprot:scaffold2800_cov93-Skeletonema_marinoi.AAC.2
MLLLCVQTSSFHNMALISVGIGILPMWVILPHISTTLFHARNPTHKLSKQLTRAYPFSRADHPPMKTLDSFASNDLCELGRAMIIRFASE